MGSKDIRIGDPFPEFPSAWQYLLFGDELIRSNPFRPCHRISGQHVFAAFSHAGEFNPAKGMSSLVAPLAEAVGRRHNAYLS